MLLLKLKKIWVFWKKNLIIRSKKLKGTPIERRIKAIDSLLLENIDLEFKKNSDNII